MNDEQYKRYRNMISDKGLQVLFVHPDKGNLHYLIQGSAKYKVSAYKTGKLTCSCPDFKYNCQVQKCYCKHILHILSKNFKDINHAIYKRTFITSDELNLLEKYKNIFK